jgi:crotonobetainyl-CoA:carnitine CoA-transferase CaiB-like acyl-CoA transferase
VRSLPPQFGAATRAVLAEAGYSAAEIEGLIASGIAIAETRKAAE